MSATIPRYLPAASHPAIGRLDIRAPARHLTAWLAALLLLAAAFFAGPASAAVDLRVESRPISDPIQAYVTVTDGAGNPIGGLTAASFTLTLDGTPLTIQPSDFSLPPSANPAKNVSIVFVMDYSSSVVGDARTAMEGAVVDFINSMSPGDYAAIVKFNGLDPDPILVAQPFTQIDGATGTDALVAAATLPFPGESTNLYDGIAAALDLFLSPPPGTGPKAVVVISDGIDNASINTQNFVLDKASSLGIPLFTIAVGTPGTAGSNVMNILAARTGASFISAPTQAEVTDAYVTISSRLDNGYLLSFVSSITDCNQHTLSVTVTGQGTQSTNFTRCDATTGPVTVPNVVNQAQAAATATIAGAGLVVGTSFTTVERHGRRRQCEQPEPGSRGGRCGWLSGEPCGVDGSGTDARPGGGAARIELDASGGDHGDQRRRPRARYSLAIVQHHRACGQRDQPEPNCRDKRGCRFGDRTDSVNWPGSGPERGEYDAGGGDHGDLVCWPGGRCGFTGVKRHGAFGQRDQPVPECWDERDGRFGGCVGRIYRPVGTAPAPAAPAFE